MQKESKNAGKLSDRGILSARVFPWSRETLFNAFADPVMLSKWWGPKGFTNSIHEFDLQPGGVWDLVMHGPGGRDFHNRSVFVSITPSERIVFDHLEPAHSFRMTISFEEYGDGTLFSFHLLFDSAEECSRVRPYILAGNEENFDRLENILAENSGQDK